MNWETLTSANYEIRDIRKTVRDSEVHLTWFWAKNIEFVYIYKSSADKALACHEINEQDLILYTPEEYKANQGYITRMNEIGRIYYRIFPCQKRDGKLIIYWQDNDNNSIDISGTKAKIYFSITYKNKLFQPLKKVKISIISELPLQKDVLVYVKKRGSVPLTLDDGTVYPFALDFSSGKTVQPEIEIKKNEYIRIFFSNGKESAYDYELIPE